MAEQRVDLIQKDFGFYSAVLSAPHTRTSATLTQALADIGSARRQLVLTEGAWNLTADHTIPANVQLRIPMGATVTIANGKTLTLQGPPYFEAPLWLQPGTTGKVRITAPGYDIPVHMLATGGAGLETGDGAGPWTGWHTVLDWTMQNVTYVFGRGAFGFPSTLVFQGSRIRVLGSGQDTTHLVFTGTGEALKFFWAGNELGEIEVGDFSLSPTNITAQKDGLVLCDISASYVHDLRIYNWWGQESVAGGTGYLVNPSNGLRLRGRDTSTYERISIDANVPVRISTNPTGLVPTRSSADANVFRDWYLIAGPTVPASNPAVFPPTGWGVVHIDDGADMTRCHWEGHHNYIGGTHAVYWSTTNGPSGTVGGSVIQNIDWEQNTDQAGWMIYLSWVKHVQIPEIFSQIQDMRLIKVTGGLAGNGIYLRGCRGDTALDQVTWVGWAGNAGGGGTSIDVNNSVQTLIMTGCNLGGNPPNTLAKIGGASSDHFNLLGISGGGSARDIPSSGYWALTSFGFAPYLTIMGSRYDLPVGAGGILRTHPILKGLTTPGDTTYTKRVGYILKQGNIIQAVVNLIINVKGTIAGGLYISLADAANFPADPFLPPAYPNPPDIFYSIAVGQYSGITFTTGYTQLVATMPSSSGNIFLSQSGSGVALAPLTDTNIANGAELNLTVHYFSGTVTP